MGSSQPMPAKMVDMQVMPPMWPESIQALVRLDRRRRVVDPRDSGIMEGQLFSKEHTFADSNHFMDLLDRSGSGDLHQASLARLYEERQNNAISLLRQQLDMLNMHRYEAERRQIQIMEESGYEPLYAVGAEEPMSSEDSPRFESFLGDDGPSSWSSVPGGSESCSSEIEGDNSVEYWRERAQGYAKLFSDSNRREQVLIQKLSEYASPSPTSQPLEELRQQLHRLDNFLRFTLRKAPVVIAHQDSDLRYRFIYNAFPTLTEEEVIGKTDIEIYKGAGVTELEDFKREVLQKGFPEKREITFNTDLFGEKTFLVAVEPVLTRAGEAMGLNYIAMDVSEQVDRREKLARLREQVAVQKAMESELHKTIHITEETMRAKQMLATMSHEIRSPLSGVVSMAEVLATTQLDEEQRQLVDVMVSSGDLVLQLINDILDLSKVQSGAMKFEAKKFRPREVVKHVLQMALASMQKKDLILEGRVYDDVPLEVTGDVLRIRQVFTNLVSNAIKFTHEGSVSINVRIEPPPPPPAERASNVVFVATSSNSLTDTIPRTGASTCASRPMHVPFTVFENDVNQSSQPCSPDLKEGHSRLITEHSVPVGLAAHRELEADEQVVEDTVWLHCDVCDTGIGIPEEALPTLFDKYTQVSTTHARKYGGTGLGLAICKNLVELMGGSLTVASKENQGSKFSFRLPLRVAPQRSLSTGQLSEELYVNMTNQAKQDVAAEKLATTKEVGYFHFTSKVPPISPSENTTQPLSRSSGTLMANSLACSSTAGSEQSVISKGVLPFEQRIPSSSKVSSYGGKKLASLQKPMGMLGFFQDSSPEYMDVDSGPSNMKYIPGLSMPHGETPGGMKNSTDGPWLCTPTKGARSPRGPNASRKVGKSQGKEDPTPPGTPHQRRSRILLAEDNKVNVMVAQSMLKRLGHKLEVVSNGAEALQAVQRKSYDVILMDVCMPVMDGLEATRRIRRYEETGSFMEEVEAKRSAEATSPKMDPSEEQCTTPATYQSKKQRRTPIIAMTANALADNMMECYTQGMDSFIAKPVTFTKLEQVLRQFIPCFDHTRNSS